MSFKYADKDSLEKLVANYEDIIPRRDLEELVQRIWAWHIMTHEAGITDWEWADLANKGEL